MHYISYENYGTRNLLLLIDTIYLVKNNIRILLLKNYTNIFYYMYVYLLPLMIQDSAITCAEIAPVCSTVTRFLVGFRPATRGWVLWLGTDRELTGLHHSRITYWGAGRLLARPTYTTTYTVTCFCGNYIFFKIRDIIQDIVTGNR